MFVSKKTEKQLDLDSRGNPVMTASNLYFYCQQQGQFSVSEKVEQLCLHHKGFTRIIPETISQFHNLVILSLNHNALSKIEGLHRLTSLSSLALNNNFITKMEGLECLCNLDSLNLSHNKIEVIEGLSTLEKLRTLNLATNFIVDPSSLAGIVHCKVLSSLDLSHNELENSEASFGQIVNNRHLHCLYLKATPLSQSFRNYRKKLIAALKGLKFLDDRPVLQKDHRLAEAWIEGGRELQEAEKQKLAAQKKRRDEEERAEVSIGRENDKLSKGREKEKVQSFIADVQETSIRISNIDEEEEEERIIEKYFKEEKRQVERNLRKQEEEERKEKANLLYYQNHENELIAEKVKEMLGNNGDEQEMTSKRVEAKWSPKYEKLLEALVLRYRFDFGQIQPSFNMMLHNINKKLMKPPLRFQISELRKVWTDLELRRRAIDTANTH